MAGWFRVDRVIAMTQSSRTSPHAPANLWQGRPCHQSAIAGRRARLDIALSYA